MNRVKGTSKTSCNRKGLWTSRQIPECVQIGNHLIPGKSYKIISIKSVIFDQIFFWKNLESGTENSISTSENELLIKNPSYFRVSKTWFLQFSTFSAILALSNESVNSVEC